MGDKILLDENPFLVDLASWDLPLLRFFSESIWGDPEKLRRLI